MTGALELRQVSRSYGEGATLVEALQAIDLCVDAGELVEATLHRDEGFRHQPVDFVPGCCDVGSDCIA